MLIKASSLRKGMPEALRILGESMQVNRVLVIREYREPGAVPMLRHAWQAPGIRVPLDALPIPATSAFSASLAAWRAPLGKGEPVIGHLATSAGALQTLLDRAPKQSTLMVPIFVVDRLWGNLAVDAGSTARQWTVSDVDILNTFADITGSLIQRSQSGRALERSEERFRVLGATAQDAIIHVDGAGRIGSWNRAAERILGYTAQEAVGRQVQELLAPTRFREASDRAMQLFRSTGQSGAIGKTRELIARRKDGTEIAVELSIAGAWLGGGWEAIGILRDITQRRSAEDELQLANLLLRTQMEASPDGILIVDANMKIVSFNQRFADMWNLPPAQMTVGADAVVLPSVVALVKDPAAYLARVGYLYGHPGEDSSEELETTDGRSIDRHSVTLHSPAGKYLARAWFFRDVSARKQAAALALRMARFDSLTGLANRSVFVEALQQAIASAKRGDKGLAVLYLDLDHFKDVNDTLGHPVGDELLKAVAERMRSVSRETDTVARFGGDEFAVIVAATADPAAAAILADKLIKALAEPFAVLGNTLRTGASIGIATWGPDALDAETLLSHADVALYRAKSDGRGSYRFFTDAMNAEVRSRVLLGAELREAIDADQLFLMYQPQIEVDGGRISAVEALLRWRHPRLGVLEPEAFMPVAGQIGLVVQLGHWVIWEACRQARIWRDAGMAPQRISIKVTALQFRDSMAFEADIAAALAATGTPPDMLELELTDLMLMQVSREHGQILERLRNAGVTIAVGDFGTGYSSLEYLQRFPRNRIKIASNSISKIDSLPGDAMIVKASIGLARDLGIRVVAAGVDTQGQFDLLKRWGCSVVQGNHLARPLGAEAATQLLRKGAGPRLDAAPGHET